MAQSTGRALLSDWSGNSFIMVVYEEKFESSFVQKILTEVKNFLIDNYYKATEVSALPAVCIAVTGVWISK